MSSEVFIYDVFLRHRIKDKAVVRDMAERLKKDGLRKASQLSTFTSSIFHRLVPFSRPAEQGPPLPLLSRLDDAPIKGSLTQFLYINRKTHKMSNFFALSIRNQ